MRTGELFQEKDRGEDIFNNIIQGKAYTTLEDEGAMLPQSTQLHQQKSWTGVLRQVCGARTHVECHDDGQPSAAGFPPPPLSFLRYDRPMENDQKIAPRRNGENRALWGAAWGGCGREDRGKAWRREEPQIKSNARQFVQFLWDRHSYSWEKGEQTDEYEATVSFPSINPKI